MKIYCNSFTRSFLCSFFLCFGTIDAFFFYYYSKKYSNSNVMEDVYPDINIG